MLEERERSGGEPAGGPARTAAVAICIVTHNSARELPGCMQALAALDPAPLEVVVVDSASDDGSADLARRSAPSGLPVEVRALTENLGFAGAMNLAIACSRAPLVLSLNPDARPAPDALVHLTARIAGDRVGGVAARLVRPGDPDFSLLDACGMRLSPAWRHFDRGSCRVDRGQFATASWVFGTTGAASLYRREALEDVAIDGKVFAPEFASQHILIVQDAGRIAVAYEQALHGVSAQHVRQPDHVIGGGRVGAQVIALQRREIGRERGAGREINASARVPPGPGQAGQTGDGAHGHAAV